MARYISAISAFSLFHHLWRILPRAETSGFRLGFFRVSNADGRNAQSPSAQLNVKNSRLHLQATRHRGQKPPLRQPRFEGQPPTTTKASRRLASRLSDAYRCSETQRDEIAWSRFRSHQEGDHLVQQHCGHFEARRDPLINSIGGRRKMFEWKVKKFILYKYNTVGKIFLRCYFPFFSHFQLSLKNHVFGFSEGRVG